MLPGENEVAAEIKVRYAKELAAMTGLHDAVVSMMTAEKWTISRGGGTQRFTIEIILGLLTKACKTFRSIQVLCERGLHEDANALVRVLLETTVATLFVLQRRRRDKNTNALTPTAHERAITFFAYSLHQQLKMLNDWKQTRGLKRQAPKRAIDAAKKQIAELRTLLPAGTNFETHWSGKGNLQNTVKALRADSLYAVLFRYTSSISHASDVGLHSEPDSTTGRFDLADRPSR